MKGRWFSGSNAYSESAPAIFLPVLSGGSYGYYWSSTANNSSSAYHLYFSGSSVDVRSNYRSGAYSVRCLKN